MITKDNQDEFTLEAVGEPIDGSAEDPIERMLNSSQQPGGDPGSGGDEGNPEAEPGSPESSAASQDKGGEMPLSKYFGDQYSDPEKVKKLISRGEAFSDDVERELNELRSQKQSFQNQPPVSFKNVNYYKLDRLEEIDPDNVGVYRKILFGTPDPMELVRLKTVAENPDVFKEDPEALDLYLEDKYPALFGDHKDPDSPEYKRDMTKLKVDANSAKKQFQAKIDSVTLPDGKAQQEQEQALRAKTAEKWVTPWNKVRESFTKIPVTVTDKNGKPGGVMMNIELKPEETKPFLQKAAQFVIQGKLEPTPENVENVKSFLMSLWIRENLAYYNTKIADHIAQSRDGNWRRTVHNPSTNTQKPATSSEKEPVNELMQQLKSDGEIFTQY